ncbi:MAG: CBS domain-containing protein [Limnothrix sp.]|uniref:CBS domain-containing protein n=1 Tax=unclassified Limnothrix TaxID=2632864 RepID=UPI00081E7F2D|nr:MULTISPECIES: CBS domain-containing protein [unclassified Limnothrix]MEB3118361.1 CBS domain-containing protein [Limnothrix sp.]OCQ94930.1 phosphoribulokinase [Limnothrix sp. P13C2]MBD2551980.1 CBS domain-containing protein [Limnothrix sp. FACHB-708]MBD2589660.1 CBS domain-containing protein [Limnothrix sp. FACHB-406]PIB13606.1 phosphoribulokinase [Limnothrix sp. PR1529]
MAATVADVMSRDPIVVRRDTSLIEVIKLLAEQRISGVPVVDEAGQLIGVVSESDLMWQETGVDVPPFITILDSVIYLKNPLQFEKELHKALGSTVADVMSDRVKTTKPDTLLRDATRHLLEGNIHRMPVVDDAGAIVGILTRGDIIRAMANGLQ